MFVVILFASSPFIAKAAYDPTTQPTSFKTLNITWHDADRDRDVPVKIYYPAAPPASPLPVIIFSHGLGGSRDGYSYLGKCWAAHGYVSVHLTHLGSDTDAVLANGFADMKLTMKRIVTNPYIAVDRCKDVSFVIDQITDASHDNAFPLHGRLDLKHIGMAGHSYGGNTTMLIAGEQTISGRSFADPRITCAIAMSPPVATPRPAWDRAYAQIKIPLFVMTGTLDDSPVGETKAAQRRVPFDHVASIPAYLITFTGGDHMVFSGRGIAAKRPKDDRFHQLILEGTTAFWDAYLRGDKDAAAWLKNTYAQSVGSDGVFEQK